MSDAQSIKDKIDIVEFIRSRLQLQPAGRNFKAACPFHKEKTPSFVVSPERQIWHCFGCGKGGDVIKFLMEYENIEFFEALKILAEQAGVELKRSGFDQKQFDVLYDINRAAKDAFHSYLLKDDESAQKAHAYLKERGLTEETIKEFEIGLAPAMRDAMLQKLTRSGFNIKDIERAGLVYRTERGTYWDRFQNRIMFPLYNSFGKTIGFSGRIVPWVNAENTGKYVNSPETPIFHKSKLLFGLHKSKGDIRETKTAVLVEGQMDFLSCWQDGIKNAVATSGTALTPEHLKNLKRFAENLVLIFDIDEAGQMAAERTIDLAESNDFNVRVFPYAALEEHGLEAKDPADIVQAKPGLIKELIKKAEPAMEYYFRRYLRDVSDIAARKKSVRSVLQKIKHIASSVERSHWIQELGKRTNISERALTEEFDHVGTTTQRTEKAQEAPQKIFEPKNRKEAISQRLLSLVHVYRDFLPALTSYKEELPEEYARVCGHLQDGGDPEPHIRPLIDFLVLRSGLEVYGDEEAAHEEFSDLTRQLRIETLKERRRIAQENIQRAESTGGENQEALKEFDMLSKELHNM